MAGCCFRHDRCDQAAQRKLAAGSGRLQGRLRHASAPYAPVRPRSNSRAAPRHLLLVCQAQKNEQNRLFVFGLGYTGIGAAYYFQQKGWSVAGTCRYEEKCASLEARGIAAWKWDCDEDFELDFEAAEALRSATHVLSTIPPAGARDPVAHVHSQLLESAEELRWLGYISSTSVYGGHEGAWVDEESELRALSPKALARIVAENEWQSLACSFDLPVHIFRCGGIYGPRRSALDATQAAQAGLPASTSQAKRAQQQYTARCHVLDICRVLDASTRHPNPTAVYNVVDDDPAGRETVMQYAAELLRRQTLGLPLYDPDTGRPVPGPGPASSSHSDVGRGSSNGCGVDGSASNGNGSSSSTSSMRSGSPVLAGSAGQPGSSDSEADDAYGRAGKRYAAYSVQQHPEKQELEEKRVSNALIKTELGLKLAFPTYREGLAAIASGDTRPYVH